MPPAPAISSFLKPGERLAKGQMAVATDNSTMLIVQTDSQVVLYGKNADGSLKVLWFSGTYGKNVAYMINQLDGNLVIYDVNGVALWSTRTNGRIGAMLEVQHERAVFSIGPTPLWVVPAQPAAPPPPRRTTTVLPGEGWWSVAVRVGLGGANYPTLVKLNGGNEARVLHAGEVLVLP
jgi:hypothetical protein